MKEVRAMERRPTKLELGIFFPSVYTIVNKRQSMVAKESLPQPLQTGGSKS